MSLWSPALGCKCLRGGGEHIHIFLGLLPAHLSMTVMYVQKVIEDRKQQPVDPQPQTGLRLN